MGILVIYQGSGAAMELCCDGKVRTWRPGKAGPPSPNSHPGQKRVLFLSYPNPGLPLSTPGDQKEEKPLSLWKNG